MAARRYIPIRFVKPAEFHPQGATFKVYALPSGKDITMQVPAHYADQFWTARQGTRLQASIFMEPKRVQHGHRGAVRMAKERVTLRFAEIVEQEG